MARNTVNICLALYSSFVIPSWGFLLRAQPYQSWTNLFHLGVKVIKLYKNNDQWKSFSFIANSMYIGGSCLSIDSHNESITFCKQMRTEFLRNRGFFRRYWKKNEKKCNRYIDIDIYFEYYTCFLIFFYIYDEAEYLWKAIKVSTGFLYRFNFLGIDFVFAFEIVSQFVEILGKLAIGSQGLFFSTFEIYAFHKSSR